MHRTRGNAFLLLTVLTVAVATGSCSNDEVAAPTERTVAVIDTTALTVTSVTPVSASVGVPRNSTVTVKFSKAISTSTVNDKTFSVGGVVGTIQIGDDGMFSRFSPKPHS